MTKISQTKLDTDQLFEAKNITQLFCQDIKELYLNILAEFESGKKFIITKNSNSENLPLPVENFSKDLLILIIFLYFMQQKSYLQKSPDTCNENQSLRENFYKIVRNNKNFFKNYLFPLLLKFTNKKWNNYSIEIANEIFSNKIITTPQKNNVGIFDILDKYNFSSDENCNDNKHNKINPNIIGDVFEKLLQLNDKKAKGTFYTPSKIVKYMCKNCLIQYLQTQLDIRKEEISKFIDYCNNVFENNFLQNKNNINIKENFKQIYKNSQNIDKMLADIKICDPAIGTGAFAVEILEMIVNIRYSLMAFQLIKKNSTKFDIKKHAIENSIYGMDIEEGAVCVTKLRLLLSLISEDDNKEIPELDYKIICENSLSNTSLNHFKQIFEKNKGFDIVIGNPPYIPYKKIAKIYDLSQYYSFNNKQINKPNLYVYFIEHALNRLLKPEGILYYIVPITFLVQSDCIMFRKFILSKNIKEMLDLSYINIFQKADTYTMILGMQNNENISDFYYQRYFNIEELNTLEKIEYPINTALNDSENRIILSKDLEIISKISNNPNILEDYTDIICGTSKEGFGKYITNKKTETNFPILQSSDILKYKINWQKKYIDKDIYSKNKIKNYFECPKIVMARMTDTIRCSLDIKDGYYCGKINVIISKTNDITMLKIILAILNSNLINYYYREIYRVLHKKGDALNFDIPSINKIPMPDIFTLKKYSKILIPLVDEIYKITNSIDYLDNKNSQDKVCKLEFQIDRIVYTIYNLNAKEISVISNQI